MRPAWYLALVLATGASAAVRTGTVSLPTGSSGYTAALDSVTEDTAAADVSIAQGGCSLTCPGECSYSVAAAYATYLLTTPLASIDFSAPLDSTDMTLMSRETIAFGASVGYDWTDTSQLAFIVTTAGGCHLLMVATAFEVKPNLPPSPCFGAEIYRMTFWYAYQDDGSMLFEEPAGVVSGRRPCLGARTNWTAQHRVPGVGDRPARSFGARYDLAGRRLCPAAERTPAVELRQAR